MKATITKNTITPGTFKYMLMRIGKNSTHCSFSNYKTTLYRMVIREKLELKK